MNILALDTSSTACSVGLLRGDDISSLHRIQPLQQAQSILPMIEELLSIAKIDLKQLDAIAFGCGPGSFTGVRIATSVTQGLAYSLGLPVIPISSLAALAQAAYMDLGWTKLWAALDARIQEVYWGSYLVDAEGKAMLIGKERVTPPGQMNLPDAAEWYGVGNAWKIYAGQIPQTPLAIDDTRLPMAAGILELAKVKYAKKEWVSAIDARPIYLRDSVVLAS